eukprot:940198-Amphidinium_carterae.2
MPKSASADVAEEETWEEGGEDWYEEGGEEWQEEEQPEAAHAEIEEEVFCAKARDHGELDGAWLHRVHSTPRSTTFKPDYRDMRRQASTSRSRSGRLLIGEEDMGTDFIRPIIMEHNEALIRSFRQEQFHGCHNCGHFNSSLAILGPACL